MSLIMNHGVCLARQPRQESCKRAKLLIPAFLTHGELRAVEINHAESPERSIVE
jgi:hypothetical protein